MLLLVSTYLGETLTACCIATVIVGEVANFAAYAFAPAILVTPLGALSIIISAVLARIILREKLHTFGILGCALCVVGSTTIVLHAPQEREIQSVKEVWDLATEPAFLLYAVVVIIAVLILIFHYLPQYGQTHIMFYIGVCSLMGSLSVMSVKALGIALKLTLSGTNQLIYPETWAFTLIVIVCVLTQMNYLNKKKKEISLSRVTSADYPYARALQESKWQSRNLCDAEENERDTFNCVQQNLITLGRIFGIDFQGYEEEATELLMQIDSCRQVRRMELDVEIKKIKIKGAQQLKNLVAFDVKFKSSGKRNMGRLTSSSA
ncbi:hypothetical protein MTR67_043907 [Solanum verrucosum]|uniref:Probable magnesium transporter n=1 Tax=Solanum verrucosum TaxID=315347 RepID=A0AAF0ZSG1_SOLVR|nr:hypothetical protein MTR67_043907 [Solanum verrucosum]